MDKDADEGKSLEWILSVCIHNQEGEKQGTRNKEQGTRNKEQGTRTEKLRAIKYYQILWQLLVHEIIFINYPIKQIL